MCRWRSGLLLGFNMPISMPETAMVMAAGLGKRMRPLTSTRPKPLVEVAGKALIDHVLAHLANAGVKRVVVNVHYMADAMETHLRAGGLGMEIIVSDEREKLLETGGGLVNAKQLIGDAPFFCINADNFWVDGPTSALHLLAERWNPATMDMLLLLIPQARAHCHSGRGDFYLDSAGVISRKKPSRIAPFVMSGVQIIDPKVITDPPSDVFSTNVFWDRAIAAGRCYGVVHQGMWFDVGTPPAIKATEAILLDG
jgi:MurNAc alpha-1-phosphate uridylyltransferase